MQALLCISIIAFAQTPEDTVKIEPKWKLEGVTGINFSQTSLVNWAAGGENTIAGNAYLNGALIYNEGKWLWENNLALDYGLSKIQDQHVRKVSDKIDFASKIGYRMKPKLLGTMLFDFKTQFAKGYNYPNIDEHISTFMAPAYSTLSLGVEYRPNENFFVYYSPLAAKFTFVQDDFLSTKGMFGVAPGEKFKSELGSYLKTVYKTELMENVNLISKLDLFTAYNSSFGNIDVDWDVLINMKINKYLTAMLNTTLKYDDDVAYIDEKGEKSGPRVQFKEIFGVGIAYKF